MTQGSLPRSFKAIRVGRPVVDHVDRRPPKINHPWSQNQHQREKTPSSWGIGLFDLEKHLNMHSTELTTPSSIRVFFSQLFVFSSSTSPLPSSAFDSGIRVFPLRDVASSDAKNDKASTSTPATGLQIPVAQSSGINLRIEHTKNLQWHRHNKMVALETT
ncbi:uncharacterized protein G2W53_010310 [Senna tora]|uniref:Uncharacterized protein n=1 Tax=Senna tora TaxID=362788 RepID=A0A835C980_9FABA|nr:uncharacterized protein G2W53_010310 [Senna tora]